MDTAFNYRYTEWLVALDRWCEKHHGITRQQAMSILFDDGAYNPNGPDLVVAKDLFWKESNEFYTLFSNKTLPLNYTHPT